MGRGGVRGGRWGVVVACLAVYGGAKVVVEELDGAFVEAGDEGELVHVGEDSLVGLGRLA
eukprot:380282-Prymnesium_polylepis.1